MSNFTVVNGDIIRAYDFKPMVGRDDCFIEGEVIDCHNIEQGYQAYKIRVTKDHFGNDDVNTVAGPDNRVNHTVFVPWHVSFNEFQGRVINLSR